MIIRPSAKFTSDLPSEPAKTDGHGRVVRYGGRAVLAAVAEMLENFGCSVGPIHYDSDLGWRAYFSWKGRRFSCSVFYIEGYVLQTSDQGWISSGFKKSKQIYADALTQLARALDSDPRFHHIEWYFRTTLLGYGAGARRPVSLPR